MPFAHAFMKISISCLVLVFFKYQAFYAYGKLTIYLQQTLNKQTKKADHTAKKYLPQAEFTAVLPVALHSHALTPISFPLHLHGRGC